MTREHAVKLKKNEYFIADLIGLKVYTEDDAFLGTLDDVIQTGANDVYAGSDGRRKGDPDPGDPSVYSGSRCGRRPHESASAGRAGGSMNFHVLTLFPEMIEQGMNTSIIGQGDRTGIY